MRRKLQEKLPLRFLPEPQYTEMHNLCCNFDEFRDHEQKIDQESQTELNVLCDLWISWHESLLKSHGMELTAAVDDTDQWSRKKAQEEAKKVGIRANQSTDALKKDLRRLNRLPKVEARVGYLRNYLASMVSLPSFKVISEEYKDLFIQKCLHSSSFETADETTIVKTLASQVYSLILPILQVIVDHNTMTPNAAFNFDWFDEKRCDELQSLITVCFGLYFNGTIGHMRDVQMSRFKFRDTGPDVDLYLDNHDECDRKKRRRRR